MKEQIIKLLNDLEVKTRVDLIIAGDKLDIFGSQSGEKIINALFINDLASFSDKELTSNKLVRKFFSKYGLIFFDDKELRLLPPSLMPAVIALKNITEVKEYLEEYLKYDEKLSEISIFAVPSSTIPENYLSFTRNLCSDIRDCKFLSENTFEYINLDLAIDFLNDLPKVKKHDGLKIELEVSKEYFDGSQKRIYSTKFEIGIGIPSIGFTFNNDELVKLGEIDFKTSMIYQQGLNYPELQLKYSNGKEIKGDYFLMVKYYNEYFKPFLKPGNNNLKISIR